MSFNEIKQYYIDNHGESSGMYVLTTDVRVVDRKPIIESIEYNDGSKDEIVQTDVPDVYPADCMLQFGGDDFIGGNQLTVFDGLNIVTLEVDDPNAEFAYDALDEFLN